MTKVPLVMKTWAGDAPHDMDYITRSIPSLLASDLPDNVQVIIYDDCSPNQALRNYLKSIASQDHRVRIIFGEQNKGPNLAQQDIYQQITEEFADTPFYLNVDDDVIYHRDWLTQLTHAFHSCQEIGREGVFTALNMPYRIPFEEVLAGGMRLLLKWKQPALNWLIPRSVYSAVGPFRDEGIAYDTVYSHWMRLKGYPIFCMVPSYVQNIGLLGAYATDDTTTALDFVGTNPVERIQHALGYHMRRFPDYLRHQFGQAARMIAPIRWGTEFVHEGIRRDGTHVAIYTFDDARRMGWDADRAAARVEQIAGIYKAGGKIELAPTLLRNREGKPVWIESPWRFMPNLREMRFFELPKQPSPRTLMQAILNQLKILHEKAVVHNKVRPENVYVDQQTGALHLAWLGTEPCTGQDFTQISKDNLVTQLSGALNRWVRQDVREIFARRYLECIAPEVIAGQPASMQSDIYSAAAVTASFMRPGSNLSGELLRAGETDNQANLEDIRQSDNALYGLLSSCMQKEPSKRPADAIQALQLLAG